MELFLKLDCILHKVSYINCKNHIKNFSGYVTEIKAYYEIDGLDPDAIQDIFDKDDEVLADL